MAEPHVQLIKQLRASKFRAKGAVGITTFIKKTLMRGVKYVPPVQARIKGKRGAKAQQRGLWLGRKLDRALQTYIQTGQKCASIMRVLAQFRRRGLTLVAAQVPVGCKKLKLKTTIDAVAVSDIGDVYVVELKNSQMSIKQHEESYAMPALRNTHLSNGLLNSEHNRHGLQAYFGVLALKETCNIAAAPIVVVNCSNGCRLHRHSKTAYNINHYKSDKQLAKLVR